MQIIREEQHPLDIKEQALLKRIRDNKRIAFASAYAALLFILIVAFIMGFSKAETARNVERAGRFRTMTPIVMGFFFIVLNIYFIRYYRRAVLPFVRDFKNGLKRVIYFYPESYKTPYFDTFYLRTHLSKRPMLRISPEMYKAIQPGTTGEVCMLPNSRFVLSLKVGNEIMEFNEKNTIIDH